MIASYGDYAILDIIPQPMQRSEANKRIQFWIGVAVSVISLAALFIFIKPAQILEALKSTHYELWLLASVSLVLFLLIRAVRWRFMLNSSLKPAQIAYGSVFHIQNIGYMATNILPFRLGDVVRAVLIGNVPPATISLGISTMVVERVFDLLFIVILFPFTFAAVEQLPPEVQQVARLTGFLAIAATLVLIGAANKRQPAIKVADYFLRRFPFLNRQAWLKRLDDLLRGLGVFTSFKNTAIMITLSIVVWLPIIAGYYVGLLAVNLQPSLTEAAFVVCIAAFSVAAPSSPGQIGVFEASVTFALAGILGMPEAEAASFAFLYHAVNYIVLGVLGIIGITRTGETFGSVLSSSRTLVQSRSTKKI